MSLGRYVVEAIVAEGRSPTELASRHGTSRSWIDELLPATASVARGLEPRSRRPRGTG